MAVNLNDAELVQRVRSGETEAFTVLVHRYENAIYGVAYHYLGNFEDARDVAQEAFIRAYSGLHRLDDPHKFGPWLRQVAVNQCRMRRRRPRTTEPLDASLPAADATGQAETRVAVQQALACLSETLRLTVTLFYMQSFSIREIADFLEVPVTTIKSRLRDARARLKKEMAGMVEETLKQQSVPTGFAVRVQELIEASATGNVASVRKLVIDDRSLLNVEGTGFVWYGDSPALHLAVNRGHLKVVEFLLQQGADPNVKSEHGWTPLLIAAGLESREIFELLLSHGAQPDIFTALKLDDVAAIQSHLEADPGQVAVRGPWGATPLHIARTADVAQLLLDNGAELDPLDEYFQSTPVDYQCYNPSVLLLLIERGAAVDILVACYLGDFERIGDLLNTDPKLIDKASYKRHRPGQGATPLGIAAQEGNVDVAAFLLNHGADPSAPGASGLTPLHWAAMYGRREITALLLKHGADVTVKTDGAAGRWDVKTPLEVAVEAFEKGLCFEDEKRDYEGVLALLG